MKLWRVELSCYHHLYVTAHDEAEAALLVGPWVDSHRTPVMDELVVVLVEEIPLDKAMIVAVETAV